MKLVAKRHKSTKKLLSDWMEDLGMYDGGSREAQNWERRTTACIIADMKLMGKTIPHTPFHLAVVSSHTRKIFVEYEAKVLKTFTRGKTITLHYYKRNRLGH